MDSAPGSAPTVISASLGGPASGVPAAATVSGPPLATSSMLPTVIHLPARRTLVPWLVALAIAAILVIFRRALTFAFFAFAVAYVFAPAVRWAERFRIPRPITILLVMLSGTALVTASAAVLIPEFLRQSETLINQVPKYSAHIQREWLPYLRNRWHIRLPPRTEDALGHLGLRLSSVAPRIGEILNGTVELTIQLIEFLFTALIVLALAFYMLLDFDRLQSRVFEFVPHRIRPRAELIAREIDQTLRHFVNGQLLVMAVLGGLYGIGLGLLRVPAWWAIGLFAGMISFVPYLGFIVAAVLAMFMAALQGQGASHVAAVMGVMVAVHILDLTLITPRILGGRAKISPVVVLLSLVAGGTVFGFLGVLVAIPAASVLRVLLRELVAHYQNTAFFQARPGGAMFSTPPSAPIAVGGPGNSLASEMPTVLITPGHVVSIPPGSADGTGSHTAIITGRHSSLVTLPSSPSLTPPSPQASALAGSPPDAAPQAATRSTEPASS